MIAIKIGLMSTEDLELIYRLVDEIDPEEEYGKNEARDSKEIKKSLKIEQDYCGLHVYAIAIHKDVGKNKHLEIFADWGAPLTDNVYDTVHDSYHVEGVDFMQIATLPVNYKLVSIDSYWSVDVPLPYTVIRKYMTKEEKSKFDQWRQCYPPSSFNIKYLQVTGLF